MAGRREEGTPFHVLFSSVRKVLCIPRTIVFTSCVLHHFSHQSQSTWTALSFLTQDRSWLHGLKANHHDNIGDAAPYERAGEVEARTPGRASIVGIVDWNCGHAELVENTLT